MQIKSADYIASCVKESNYPEKLENVEIAFVGRSNVGKSSLINSLVKRKNLARTSKTPGRTQLVNFFLINKDSIAKMKKGVMIINTGRGKLINTEDLIEGVRSKQIGSAGLDVYEEEKNYFYEDRSDKMIDDDVLARLLLMPNVVLTSHQAFFTAEALHNIATTTLESIKEFEEGKILTNEVKEQ